MTQCMKDMHVSYHAPEGPKTRATPPAIIVTAGPPQANKWYRGSCLAIVLLSRIKVTWSRSN